ncbi:histone acetyltransferase 1, partial [Cladochytrium tenue]
EDASDAFQELRDRCDVRVLVESGVFAGLRAPVPAATVREMRRQFKLSKGQMDRCCEMVLLRALDRRDAEAALAYRLFVKSRLYRQNEEVLAGLGREERNAKLHEAFRAVEEAYRATLRSVDERLPRAQ